MMISTALGLDIGPASIKTARVTVDKRNISVINLLETPIDDVNPFYTALKTSVDNLGEGFLITALETRDVLVKPMEIKLTKKSEIDSVIAFQVEPMIPFPIEHAITDTVTVHRGPKNTLLTLFATQCDTVRRHLDSLQAYGVEPETISCIPHALSCFVAEFFPEHSTTFVLNIGDTSSECILVKDGVLIASRFIGYGSSTEKAEIFHKELAKAIISTESQTEEKNVATLIITGNPPDPCLRDINKTIITPDNAKFATAIGLAISALAQKKGNSINFRQREFSYPRPWKRIKKPAITFLSACLLLALSLFLCGEALIHNKETRLKRSYIELLTERGKNFKEFEQTMLLPIPSPDDLSTNDIALRLNSIYKKNEETAEMFQLCPNAPLVSDVLAWLSTHPYILKKDDITGSAEPLISMESMSYTMVKHPDASKKSDPYQVRVDISFTAPTTRQAGEFHDALLEPNAFIDPRIELKWTSSKDRYMASFHLKTRPVKPIPSEPIL